jgi:ectoine hydroxylase-related dioxygenase (phytanoyl-CoA dioxygenase family)
MTTLDTRQRMALDDFGYVVLPDVLDARMLVALRETFERAAAEQQQGAGARESGTRHVKFDFDTGAGAVADAIQHVIGRPFGLMNQGGRDPLPGFGQQGLHTDWRPRAAWEPFHAATALWLLDDFKCDNGATRVVPGSHRKGAVPKSFADPEGHHPDEKVVIARAGSVLVINGHVWHSGTRNRSKASRRVVQSAFAAREFLSQ